MQLKKNNNVYVNKLLRVCSLMIGSRTAKCAKGTIIGPNTGVYIGGLPADYIIYRKSKDSRLEVFHFVITLSENIEYLKF